MPCVDWTTWTRNRAGYRGYIGQVWSRIGVGAVSPQPIKKCEKRPTLLHVLKESCGERNVLDMPQGGGVSNKEIFQEGVARHEKNPAYWCLGVLRSLAGLVSAFLVSLHLASKDDRGARFER